jgi:hypothetical protein
LRPRSRRFLFGMLPKDAAWAEVGVWKGDFSAEVLAQARPAALHEGVRARFSAEIARGVVHLHRMTSVDAAAQFVPQHSTSSTSTPTTPTKR